MNRKCTNLPFLVLMQTSKTVQEKMKVEMTKNNLSITEFSVLEVLYFKGKQTIQQIGHRILISSGSMTYVIDRLEQKGLLTRSACPDDRRAIHVTLTDDGNDLMEHIMPIHQEWVDHMFSSLTSMESELFVELLKKVNDKMV
ncbi:MarR family transcriptional regulator [Neobacillus sp. MM2021_6]|uniref:MarR family winged helix-turn-helix transcriptional regulator n=1 Tax=Bacillaceae TaxID=186817 RepID=UPI001A94C848|nr:MarR family transcriptional regulator [Neobacillus sp. OS1-2]MBO0962437.1 MarR family transcriptional regulator [Neobacillus sp. MM2021_6]WML42021.1 MarR family transcriptional regulator [Neobacillus sp. OS1-2]